jgi:eukaryotic-like serine/threonine-protein kinase
MSRIDDLLHTGAALKGALGREALDQAAGLRLLAAGDRVGPFRILGELGRGGMGVVYEAERVDGAFEQRVAIKWLLARGGDTHVAQFRRERQILAALRHPHIARLLDGGETSDGMLWFAMERIEGRPIDRYCAERSAGRRERLDLFEQVCEAVAFAHARLLVHRDIKPSNILVDSDGSAKLVDFGIAHMLDDGSAAVDAFTPGFASPEQAAGAPSSIAADVYSLGVLLRALLHPRHAQADAIPGEAITDYAELRPSGELDAIAARAAASDPQLRYATVEALLDDLHCFRRHRPVEAFSGGHLYRLRRFLRRHWAAATVALASLALIAVLSTAFIVRISDERDQAELEAEKANAVTHFVVDLLRSADPTFHRGDKLTVLEVLAKGESKADAELHDQPEVHARLIGALADVQLSLSNYSEALRLNQRAAAILKHAPDAPAKLIALRLRTAAQSAWRMDQFELGLALVEEAQTHNVGADRDAFTAVSLLRTRANLLSALGRSEEGGRSVIEAVETARRELPGSTILGRALIDAGVDDESRADYARALQKAREAKAIFLAAETHGPAHPDTFAARGNSALYLFELNQSAAALQEVEENLGLMLGVVGEDHASYTRMAALAVRIALANGDGERAQHWMEKARRGWARVQNLGPHAWSDVALAEGDMAMRAGRAADALAWFERLHIATQGRDRDARLGSIQAHCSLGTQQQIADRVDAALFKEPLWSPRQAALRERLRQLCKAPA